MKKIIGFAGIVLVGVGGFNISIAAQNSAVAVMANDVQDDLNLTNDDLMTKRKTLFDESAFKSSGYEIYKEDSKTKITDCTDFTREPNRFIFSHCDDGFTYVFQGNFKYKVK